MAGRSAALAQAPAQRLVYLMLAALLFLADRVTKVMIETSLGLHEIRPVIPGFFQIVHVRNQGIAFGLFADSPSAAKTLLVIALSAAALLGVGYVLWTSTAGGARQNAALALILGGALGNLFDRVRAGEVVDFLDFYVGGFHWPSFNVADSAIVVGGGLLLLHLNRAGQRRRK